MLAHCISKEKHKIPLLDYYNEDDVELDFLRTKPVCFIIIGKPFCGKTTLARKLAKYWNCPLINPDELIKNAFEDQLEGGKQLKECLESGEKSREEMLFQLLKNKLFNSKLSTSGYVLDGFPTLNDSGMSTNDQLSLIESSPNKPNLVIYIKIDDRDVIKRRQTAKMDALNGTIYVQEEISEPENDESIESDTEMELEFAQDYYKSEDSISLPTPGRDEFTVLDSKVREDLVALPKRILEEGDKELKRFNKKFYIFQNYFSEFTRSRLIELNGNLPPKTLFDGLTSTLKLLQLSKPVYPIIMSNQMNITNADIEYNDFESIFNVLRIIKSRAPFFNWRLSRWGQFCPIKLKLGWMVLGKPRFSVIYRDKIYFFPHEESMNLFTENPRPFLLPPMPIHPCKFFVFGHFKTGKSRLCKKLASKYKGKVIDFEILMQRYYKDRKQLHLDDIWYDAMINAVADIQVKVVLKQTLASEKKRNLKILEKAKEWARAMIKEQTENSTTESSSETSQSVDSYADLLLQAVKSEDIAKQVDEKYKFHATFEDIGINHPKVIKIVDKAIEEAEKLGVPIDKEDYIYQLLSEIEHHRAVMSNYGTKIIRDGGWVIDNFPHDKEMFEIALQMGIIPSAIIALKDPTESYKVISKRWLKVLSELKKVSESENGMISVPKSNETEESKPTDSVQSQSRTDKSDANADVQQLMDDFTNAEVEDEPGEKIESDVQLEPTESAPPLTELELELHRLRKALRKFDTFFSDISTLLPSDGTIQIVEVAISNEKSLDFESRLDLYDDLEQRFISGVVSVGQMSTITAPFSEQVSAVDLVASDVTTSKLLKTPDEIDKEVIQNLASQFYYKRQVITNEIREQEQEELEKNVDVELSQNGSDQGIILWPGDSWQYCPVELKELRILKAGNQNIELKYKDKTYMFAKEENRERFMKKPLDYTAAKEPLQAPPIRICIVGPMGSGKTTQSRILANKLNIFHIDFRERLQELLIAKTGRKLGFPYQIDHKQIDIDETIMDEESRIESIVTSLDIPSKGVTEKFSYSPSLESHTAEKESDEITTPVEEEIPPEEIESARKSSSQQESLKSKSSNEQQSESSSELTLAPKQKFTEEEKNIKEYLQYAKELTETTLFNILNPWWNHEPFCSVGFILDGFPNSRQEADLMIEYGFVPDTFIFLDVGDIDVIQRILGTCMKKWHERVNANQKKREERINKAVAERDAAIAVRRGELMREYESINYSEVVTLESESSQSDHDEIIVDDEMEFVDIDAILDEEFPELEFEEEEEETVEDAELRYNNNILEIFQSDEDKIAEIKEVIDAAQISYQVIDGRKKAEKLESIIRKTLVQFVENRESLFEKTYPITASLAEILIESGYKAISKFGLWCPVQVYDGLIIPTRYVEDHLPLPVLHRHHIYYLSSESARSKFMQNPIKYIRQSFPKPIAPMTISVVGPPKSGKSTLAKRFAEEYYLLRLTEGESIRYILNSMSKLAICEDIKNFLHVGATIPGNLIAAVIDEILSHPLCQQQGVVFDNIPVTLDVAESLHDRSIIPFCVIELDLSKEESEERCAADIAKTGENVPFSQSLELHNIQYTLISAELDKINLFYKTQHHNMITLDATKSKWWVWNQASKHFLNYSKSVQAYIERTQAGQAASVANLGIMMKEFRSNLGAFDFFCPVSLAIDGELVDCSSIVNLRYAAQYKGKFYTMCSQEHLVMFLADPDIFLPPKVTRLPPAPHEIPKALSLEQIEEFDLSKAEFNGFCPVTYLQGLKTYEALVKGNPEFGALYLDKLYLLASEQHRELFMRKPEKYSNLTPPYKQPPQAEQIDLKALPILGYLEQTIANALVRALTEVAQKKPKYPFLDASRSAALFLGYYLKAYNPKNSSYIRKKYQKKLGEFSIDCQLLRCAIKYMTRLPTKPYLRPSDFDEILKRLFELKPDPDWIFHAPSVPRVRDLFQ